MLQDQTFELEIGQGLDKKTDPKAVVANKLLLLENAVFSEGHRLSKRYGYDALTTNTFSPYTNTTGTLTAPKMVKAYNNELVIADSNRLYSYSPTLSAWVDKGPYESIASTQMETSAAIQNVSQSYQSSAVLGNYMLSVWQVPSASVSQAYANVIDLSTGAKIYPDTALGAVPTSGNAAPKCCVLGGTTLAAFFVSGTSLKCVTFSFSGNSVTANSAVNVYTTINPIGIYDAVAASTGGVLSYNGTTKTIDTSGAITHTASGFTGVDIASITVGSNGNIWLYGASGTGTNVTTIKYIIYGPTLSVVLTSTTVGTIGPGSGVVTTGVRNLVAVADSTTQQTVIYNGDNSAATLNIPVVTKVVNSSGTVTSGTFTTASMDILSKPFYVGTSRYLFTAYHESVAATNPQPGIYLFNIDARPYTTSTTTGAVVGKTLWGSAYNGSVSGFLPNVVLVSGSKYGISVPYLAEELITGIGGTSFTYSSTLVEFDWASQDSYQALVFNKQLLLNGGLVQMYDGNVISELGFNLFPTISSASASGNAGSIPVAGNYLYVAVFQWVDNQGNLHQSATSSQVVPNVPSPSPSSQTYTIVVAAPVLTGKDPQLSKTISVALYRTASNGSLFYQVGLIQAATDPAVATSVTFTDNTTDAVLLTCLPMYTNGNVLPNDPPPPAMIMNSHNNRAWVLDSTDQNSVWYSKTSQETVGASFSGDLLVTIDSKGGGISGMSELDDKEILFKTDSRIVILYGDGANDTGNGSTLSQPYFVQTDVGCSASKSVLSQPNGVIFKSPKGWYLMDRSTQMHYIGFPVESYNSQDVTAATRMADKTLCVFLTSSGSAIAYDYFYNQWSVFTNHAGLSADIFGGSYTYVRTGGAIYKQNTSSYLDSTTTYLWKLQTAWLRLNKIQGFQRIKRLIVLGDSLSPVSGHGIQVSAAYDFVSSFFTPVAYTFPSSSGPFQYREVLARQKCDTISLLVEEVSAGAGQSGEFIDLTSIGFVAGLKKGQNKLPATQSVG